MNRSGLQGSRAPIETTVATHSLAGRMKDHHSDAFQVAEIGDGEQRSARECRLVHLIPSYFSTTFAIIPTFMTAAFSCDSVQPNFFVQYRTSASSKMFTRCSSCGTGFKFTSGTMPS